MPIQIMMDATYRLLAFETGPGQMNPPSQRDDTLGLSFIQASLTK